MRADKWNKVKKSTTALRDDFVKPPQLFTEYKKVDETRAYKDLRGDFFLDKTIIENDIDSQLQVVCLLYNFLSFTIEVD